MGLLCLALFVLLFPTFSYAEEDLEFLPLSSDFLAILNDEDHYNKYATPNHNEGYRCVQQFLCCYRCGFRPSDQRHHVDVRGGHFELQRADHGLPDGCVLLSGTIPWQEKEQPL